MPQLCDQKQIDDAMPCKYPYYSETYDITMKDVNDPNLNHLDMYIAARFKHVSQRACLADSSSIFENVEMHALTTTSEYTYLFNDDIVPQDMQQALLYAVTNHPRHIVQLLKNKQNETHTRVDYAIEEYRLRVSQVNSNDVTTVHKYLQDAQMLRTHVYLRHNCIDYCSRVHIYAVKLLNSNLQYKNTSCVIHDSGNHSTHTVHSTYERIGQPLHYTKTAMHKAIQKTNNNDMHLILLIKLCVVLLAAFIIYIFPKLRKATYSMRTSLRRYR